MLVKFSSHLWVSHLQFCHFNKFIFNPIPMCYFFAKIKKFISDLPSKNLATLNFHWITMYWHGTMVYVRGRYMNEHWNFLGLTLTCGETVCDLMHI